MGIDTHCNFAQLSWNPIIQHGQDVSHRSLSGTSFESLKNGMQTVAKCVCGTHTESVLKESQENEPSGLHLHFPRLFQVINKWQYLPSYTECSLIVHVILPSHTSTTENVGVID